MTLRSGICAAAGLLGGWALLENTALLLVRHERLPLDGFPRTAVIADLHRRRFGRNHARLVRRIAAQKPELILIAGDLCSRRMKTLEAAKNLLPKFSAIAPVIAVMGNHEIDLPPTLCAEYRRIAAESGVTLLENDWTQFGKWNIAGLRLSRAFYRGGGPLGFSGKKECTAETVQQHLGACRENTILLAHNPIFFPAYAQWGAALTVSGHVHGGAVRLPFVGGLLSPERTFFPHYDKGLFAEDGRYMEISAGLGKLRLFNPPEIVMLEGNA